MLYFTVAGSKSGDYHQDMNHENFMRWVRTQLLPNLPPSSVLVVDNASYHNVKIEKTITSASLKNDMISWLNSRKISFEEKITKPELYELIKQNQKEEDIKYALDELLASQGHSVLRLPPYHPEFNPIEKI